MLKQLKTAAEAAENLESEPNFPETELLLRPTNVSSYCSGV